MFHGYYIFKWSTPISIIKINNFLKIKQIKYESSNNNIACLLFKIIRISYYLIIIFGSYFLYPLRICLRIIFQIKLINKIRVLNKNI